MSPDSRTIQPTGGDGDAITVSQQELSESPYSPGRTVGALGAVVAISFALFWLPIVGSVIAGYVGGRVARSDREAGHAFLILLALSGLGVLAYVAEATEPLFKAAILVGSVIGYLILGFSMKWGVRSARTRLKGVPLHRVAGVHSTME